MTIDHIKEKLLQIESEAKREDITEAKKEVLRKWYRFYQRRLKEQNI